MSLIFVQNEPFYSKLKSNFDRQGFWLKYLFSLNLFAASLTFVFWLFLFLPYLFFCKTFADFFIKISLPLYRLKWEERQKTGVTTIFNYALSCIWFISTKKEYFTTIIYKLKCTLQSWFIVFTMLICHFLKKNWLSHHRIFTRGISWTTIEMICDCRPSFKHDKMFQLVPKVSKT